ncbi:alpha/beta hydrolase [Leptospira fletcheri]|uniref:Alpha/beta hydrolase n=1 Tax=Leptospira fletcheri TaxID=2484981 RepID=A0A4R9GH61_9LEPT|nr:alpha/beta hydrolase [Leptospira fletcheri]TGK12038.1 alpha/beta hydrolase [Leptospira fletcheri]
MPFDELYKPTDPSFRLSKDAVRFASDVSLGTLEGVRSFLTSSFDWMSQKLTELSDTPVLEKTELASLFRETGSSLQRASEKTNSGLIRALESTAAAMQTALGSLDQADSFVKKKLFENIPVSSIVGESFADFVTTSAIQPSFRLNGRDASASEVLQDWQRSGLTRTVLCIPGLFCDEGLWSAEGPFSPVATMVREGYYPIYLRFNPGAHISKNGEALYSLLKDLFALPEFQDEKTDFLSYSQGGLILRSAFYLAEKDGFRFSEKIRHALFVSSPDGGSYIEKIGFWLGLGAESLPVFPVNLIGYIGNQRSDAMKDLSHGLIREEDWQRKDPIGRYGQEFYFGELDEVNATQVYSLVSEKPGDWSNWIGDGIVEKSSLEALSERVYRKKANPEKRVRVLFGLSHYQILTSPGFQEVLTDCLKTNE